jgi:tetratricopeptide (TPR) repeat protein
VSAGAAKRAEWIDGWCTIAWQAWQDGRRVDAQEALRTLAAVSPAPARAQLLRGEMKLKEGDQPAAKKLWEDAVAAGAEDFRVRMALGVIARGAKETEEAEKHLLAAERLFPGYDERGLSAELNLAQLYEEEGRHDDAMKATERWLAYESGSIGEALAVAAWHAEAGRHEKSLAYFRTANEIDPFRWRLHEGWGKSLAALERREEALREFTVALEVPAALEGDRAGPPSEEDSARLLGAKAVLLMDLARTEEALDAARKALELDADCETARTVLERAR